MVSSIDWEWCKEGFNAQACGEPEPLSCARGRSRLDPRHPPECHGCRQHVLGEAAKAQKQAEEMPVARQIEVIKEFKLLRTPWTTDNEPLIRPNNGRQVVPRMEPTWCHAKCDWRPREPSISGGSTSSQVLSQSQSKQICCVVS